MRNHRRRGERGWVGGHAIWSVTDPLPSDVDPALWFETESCGRHYLVDGNAHTFPGRMWAFCAKNDIYTRVDRSEIGQCSLAAAYFIRGYLSGNEPEPPRSGTVTCSPTTSRGCVRGGGRWSSFVSTGYWWTGESRHCDRCGVELLPSQPPAEGCVDCGHTSLGSHSSL